MNWKEYRSWGKVVYGCCLDVLAYPFRYLAAYCSKNKEVRRRAPVETDRVFVCIHEWGGYAPVRHKKITAKIPEFECGLKYQLMRFAPYRGGGKFGKVKLMVTMSDPQRCPDIDGIKAQCDCFIPVSNAGMDFSGYNACYERIKDGKNAYVLLSNTSVNARQTDFLDSYLHYMEANPDVGMVGISCCSKCYQTFMRHNFTPHLQSFFLLTTLSVLREAVAFNHNRFPGTGITHKQLLIREGEIKLSQIVLRLGYNLAVVTQSGPVKFNNSPRNWSLPKGDYRLWTPTPNAIHPL